LAPDPTALLVFDDDVEDVANIGGKFGGVVGSVDDASIALDVEVPGRDPSAAAIGRDDGRLEVSDGRVTALEAIESNAD
jgi:hypothetical protein